MSITHQEIVKAKEPGKYYDGNGLMLVVTKTGTKNWQFKFKINMQERCMGLGPFAARSDEDGLTLAQARDRVIELRRLIRTGVDPLAQKKAARAKPATDRTFKAVAEKFIELHSPTWKHPKHEKQWRQSLEKYTYPVIGDMDVAAITRQDVIGVLDPIWQVVPETASRVRARIYAVMKFAKARGLRDGENPAIWVEGLDGAFPSRNKLRAVQSYAAVPFADLPKFMAELRAQDGMPARALEFGILCGSRSAEVLGATWGEVNLTDRVWTIPGSRMKNGDQHRVPLSDRAMAILNAVKPEKIDPTALVFGPMGENSLRRVLASTSYGNCTVHGFRSAFRDWAVETTSYPEIVSNMALAHRVADQTDAAYRRGDLFDKRKGLMNDWASHCEPREAEIIRFAA